MFRDLINKLWRIIEKNRPEHQPPETVIKKVMEDEFTDLAKIAGFNDDEIYKMISQSFFTATAYHVGEDWLQIVGSHK